MANRITLPINFERAWMWDYPSKMVGNKNKNKKIVILFGSIIYYLYLYIEFKNKSYELLQKSIKQC